jgi:sulfur-oxidizing protein SoxZ
MADTVLMKLTVTGDIRPAATVQVVLLIGHPMESGFRTQDSGQRIPKHVVETVTVSLDGAVVFTATLGIGVAVHPYLAFPIVLPPQTPKAGKGYVLNAHWVDNLGQHGEMSRVLPLLGA